MNESQGNSESREQVMLREEQKIKELMIEQYYKYLALLRATNNFQKCLETYARINLYEYTGNIAVIGRITEIAMINEKDQEYCLPSVTTTVNKLLFEKQESLLSKRPFIPIIRKFIVSGNNYRKKLIVPLNKVVSTGKKNKQQLFIFTHVRLLFKDEKEVCFGFSDESFIMQIDHTFYNGVFKNLELSLVSTYSDLNLNEIFTQSELMKGSTFIVQDIRNKIHENLNNFTVLGVLKKVIWTSMKKAVNAKEKEVALDIIQDIFHRNFKSIGICRIYLRFDILDQQDLLANLKQGCVYLFMVNETLLNDNVILNLKVNNWRKNFIRITHSPPRSYNNHDLYRQMKVSPMNYFMNHCIYRNYYKFNVIKYDIKLLYAKITCEKCESAVFRSGSYQYNCRNQCGRINARLRLWAIVGVMDESCYSEITMEDKVAFDYFDLTEDQLLRFKEEVAREEQELGKTGITLYFKQTKEDFNEDDPNICINQQKNQFLGALIQKLLIKVIQKTIIGTGKINVNDNFNTFDEEVKQEALTSFAKSKEFYRKAKVFVNGHLRTFEGRGRLIPYIKVESIVN